MEYEIDRYNSMDELLSKLNDNCLILSGNCEESFNRYEIINLGEKNLKIGVQYNENGIRPQIIIKAHELIIGLDEKLYLLDMDNNKIHVDKDLPSLFYENIICDDLVITICELDAIVIKNTGAVVWSIGFREIVEGYKIIDDSKLYIRTVDGDETVFLLTDGSIV